jgi:murein DD-endopeptidase MepM/ murein hydrolase activator NlpD
MQKDKNLMRKFHPVLILVFILTLTACNKTSKALPTITPSQEAQAEETNAQPTPTQSRPTPTPTLVPTEIAQSFSISSPLEGETFESLGEILSKPLDIPPFGADTGHHGMDFAYFQRGDRNSIQGIKIYSIFDGKTVLSLDDEYPYGYTMMVETPLTDLPEVWQVMLLDLYQPVPDDPGYRLYCPPVTPPQVTGEYSLYVVYAHMEAKPDFEPGDPIKSGQLLGSVGNSGYSSNPHLHLELRIGPSGANFTTMAHYQNTVTEEQMSNYCLWRMSGYYQLFDPFILMFASP